MMLLSVTMLAADEFFFTNNVTDLNNFVMYVKCKSLAILVVCECGANKCGINSPDN